jgi:phage head maturation protease
METIRRFGAFTKAVERDDGTITVEGVASTEAEDSQGETVTADAMRRAIPDYFRHGPAVREQHDPQKAAGRAIAMEVDGEGRTWISAHVVDPVTVQKVKAKVLTGFSIGGEVPPGGRDTTDPRVIHRVRLCEVSLVDRPANPEARITVWKLEAPEPERDQGEMVRKIGRRLDTMIEKVAKMESERDDAIAKAARLGHSLRKVREERDLLRAERAQIRKAHVAEVRRLTEQNADLFARIPPKGALRAVEIEKAEDNGTAPEPEGGGQEPDVHSLIKSAQRRPAQLFQPPRR